MAQPKINEFVKYSEHSSGADQSPVIDSQPTNQGTGGRGPATGRTAGKKSSNATVGKKSQDSKSKNAKRKRAIQKETRNVKAKSSQPSDQEVSLTQCLGKSLTEMLACETPLPESDSDRSAEFSLLPLPEATSLPSGTTGTAAGGSGEPAARLTRKGTRLTAVKQRLAEQLDENVRLKNAMKLLEKEIDIKNKELDCKNKCDSMQKSEIKKLTAANDNLRRELSKFKGMRKYVTNESSSDSIELTQKDSPKHVASKSHGHLDTIKQQVATAAKTLLIASESDSVGDNFTMVSYRKQKPSPENSRDNMHNTARKQPHKTGGHGYDATPLPPEDATRGRPSPASSPHRPGQATYAATASRQRNAASSAPQVAINGTSLVRGLGPMLNRRGINATTFVYRGSEIPAIRQQVNGILNKDYQPEIVVLQCGGNDARNGRPTAEVVQQFDYLVREVKKCCPRAEIIINQIPPRGHNDKLLNIISMLNTYIVNMSKDKRSRIHCSDACPKMFRFYQKDEIHFNHPGKRVYAYEMFKVISNFLRLPRLQKR